MSDAELVTSIAAGDARAEAELCRRFAGRVRLYGIRHLRDEQRSADLVQIVLLAVVVAAREGRIAEPERLDRFVLATARNSALRLRARDERLVPDATLEIAVEDVPIVDQRALMRCIDRLDERARAVVFMSFHLERETDTIASMLAMTPGHVRVVRHRALANLRVCLDGGT